MTEAQKDYARKYQNKKNKEIRERGKCVYLHRNPKTQEIFYVGIGVETRAKDKKGRSSAWNNYVNKHGYEIDIIMKGLTPKQAQSEEKRLIKLYGRRCKGEGNLVNIDSGGQGVNRSNKVYEKQRCICLSTGNVYESFLEFCKEKGASVSTVRDYMFAKEARGVKFHGKEWNVRYLSKSNQIKWFSHEKMIPSNHLEIEDVYIDDEYNYELDSLEQYRIDSFIKDVEELSCYNNKLFYLYFDKGMSLRDIHKSTRVGLNSIHNSIKEIKQILKGLDVYKYKVKKTNKSKLNKLSNKTDKNSYLIMSRSTEIKSQLMAERVTLGRNLYLSYLYLKERGLINQHLIKQRRVVRSNMQRKLSRMYLVVRLLCLSLWLRRLKRVVTII